MRQPEDKTSLCFSRNTNQDVRAQILAKVGVPSTQQYEKYLGLPTLIGRSKVSTFTRIKGRIWNRINGWKEKFLSHAGKEIIIKAVIHTIPTYTRSVFQLPKSLSHDINSMMAKFWWGHQENANKIAWMN
jgi:hypothetical protein